MNADGKSDDFVLPAKRTNKAETSVAEFVEERKSPKGSDILFASTLDLVPDTVLIQSERVSTASSDVPS